jgi:hypothetical protein
MRRLSSPTLLIGENAESKREELINAFLDNWSLYDELFERIKEEALYQRADPLRHPLIFYLGHTAVFYVNKLIAGGVIPCEKRIKQEYESLFAIGVDEMSWDDLLPDTFNWPAVKDVFIIIIILISSYSPYSTLLLFFFLLVKDITTFVDSNLIVIFFLPYLITLSYFLFY